MQKKPPFINIAIAALLAMLTVLSGFLGSVLSNELPQAVKPYLHLTLPSFGAATLAVIILTIWQVVRQSASEKDALLLKSAHRQRMLDKVHAFWIKGVLEKPLYSEAFIALGLHKQPDVVANPWHLVLQQPDQLEHPLPPGTRITQVYDDAGGELLILGDPGSGKTTLLLELARDLLDRAQKDDIHPVPVVFNLSSWAVKRQALTDWLVEELNTKYQVPRKIGQSWIAADQVLPLLDGLDEVAKEYRAACVDVINTYRQEHGLVPMVLCSRSTEYLIQKRHVLLRSAVVVVLIVGLLFWLLGGLLFWLLVGVAKEIEPVEVIAWSWQLVGRGLVFALIVGLIDSLTSKRMDQNSHMIPNQGIWRSARNGLGIGLLVLLLGGLGVGLICGLIFGPIFGLESGGKAFIQHFALRGVLWSAGHMPWRYARFLDYAADRILLRKVGGGYIFVHRLLLEYFASLDTATKSSGVSEQK